MSAQETTGHPLAEAIVQEARRAADGRLKEAERRCEELHQRAVARACELRAELLGAARLRAARLSEQVAATVPVELNRTYHGQFEEQLGDLRAEVARRLGTLSQAERRRVAQALAIDALEGFGAEAVVITLRGDDQAVFGDALAASLREKTGRTAETLIVGPSDRDGEAGPVLRSVDGRRTWDNRVSVRLARLWPELRRQLAVHLPGAAVSAAELASLCTLPGPEEGA